MKGWGFAAGAALAVGIAAVVVAVALHRRSASAHTEAIPELLQDCQARLQELDEQLSLLKPQAA